MRNISPAALATLADGQGVEPVNLVRVFWGDDGSSVLYGGRRFEGTATTVPIIGKLLEISTVDDVLNISKASNTSAMTIKLDDSDGSIKWIFDNVDIVKRTVYVYQWFTNLSTSEAFVIFEGEISTPITWKEGERTITFDVLSKIEDLQYGFSADEGNFEYIPEGIIGQAWPLPFGTVQMVPALQLFQLPSGLLGDSTSQANPNTPARSNNQLDAYNKACSSYWECINKALHCLGQARNMENDGIPPSAGFFVLPEENRSSELPQDPARTLTDQWIRKSQDYQDQAEQFRQQAANLLREIANTPTSNQSDSSLTVQNGGAFPQGVDTSIVVGGATYTGQFSGDQFTILSSSNPFATDGSLLSGPLTITDSQASTQYQAELNESNFFYTVAGASVIASGALNYIISLMEVQVQGVFANYNGLTTAVPTTLYSATYVDFGTVQATYLTVPKALSLVDPLWSDDIFCTIISPVGPNVVDILIWLIQNYTYHDYDSATFDEVRLQLAEYPCNFALLDQGNIVKLLQEIAFQSRCALWYKEGVFYIKLLAKMSTYVDEITEDDVEFGTMEISCTPTEDLVTKYVAHYKVAANAPSDDLVIWYYNQLKYGLLVKEDQYYIYSDPVLVQRASMFWLVRYTNSWKRLKISAFLNKLNLETFDYVRVNFASPYVSLTHVIGMIESASYDSANNRVELTIWLPIRFGEMVRYPFSAPYDIDPTLVFPQTYEQANAASGTTQSQASGQLFPQTGTNQKKSKPNASQPGGGTTASDTGFTAPTFELSIDPGAMTNSPPPASSTKKASQYVMKPVTNPDLLFDSPGVFPGFVRKKVSANVYKVDCYFTGLDGDVTSVDVRQLKIDKDDTIPDGSPVLVNRCRILISTDKITGLSSYRSEYTMAIPIWLRDPTSDTSSTPPDVPVSDPGTDASGDSGSSGEPGPTSSEDAESSGDQGLS